jgi:hypothetical protein
MPTARFFLASMIVALTAAPAFAQETVVLVPAGPGTVAPAPVATPAPQNEDWNNVSHINGTPVKIGEKHEYLYRNRKTNLSTNPIGWIFGIYGVSASHAVHDHVAVRVDANYMNLEGTSGYELGIGLPIYFRRVYSGPFLEPGLITRGSKPDDSYCSYGGASECSTEMGETFTGPAAMFGWHWMFDSGLNVAAALGAARDLSPQRDEYGNSYGSEIQPAGYFRIGYAF